MAAIHSIASLKVLVENALASRQAFQANLGNISRSTFIRMQDRGEIPPPDAWIGSKAMWKISTIRETVDALIARGDSAVPANNRPHPAKKRAVAAQGATQGGAQ